MGHPRYTKEEIVHRGKEWYEQIRSRIEEDQNRGKVLVIDVETGEYEVDENGIQAAHRARSKHADAALYAVRIGYPAFARIGGGWGAEKG
jgi:hypothetical protein